MNHLDWDELWSYVESGPSRLSLSKVSHSEDCQVCKHRIELAQKAHAAIVQTWSGLTPTIPSDADARLLDALRNQSPIPVRARGRAVRGRYVASSVAAAVLLVGIVTVYWGHSDMHGTSAASSATAIHETSAAAEPAQMASAADGQKGASDTAAQSQVAAMQSSVSVQDESGRDLAGVHVAFVTDGHIQTSAVTGTDGVANGQRAEQGVAQTAAASFPGMDKINSRSTIVVVWKQGYAPAVGLLPAIQPNGDGRLEVTLKMIPGDGNGATPSVVPGCKALPASEASALYAWVADVVR